MIQLMKFYIVKDNDSTSNINTSKESSLKVVDKAGNKVGIVNNIGNLPVSIGDFFIEIEIQQRKKIK